MNDTLVLIPTYNNAGTLEDVVRRALAQGLPVMVVNDGCTDETEQILSRLTESIDLSGALPSVSSFASRELEQVPFHSACRRFARTGS